MRKLKHRYQILRSIYISTYEFVKTVYMEVNKSRGGIYNYVHPIQHCLILILFDGGVSPVGGIRILHGSLSP